MGKSKVWINGQLINEHFGGFLPVIADITPYVTFEKENVIAVCADNSDDPSYPPVRHRMYWTLLIAGALPGLLVDSSQ